MMQGQANMRSGYVSGEFLTPTHRVNGEVELRSEPLLDQLNNQNAQLLRLERVFVSPLLEAKTVIGNYPSSEVRKDRLALVVLKQMRDGLPRYEGRYTGRDLVEHRVKVIAAGFEITGIVRLHATVNLYTFMRTTPEQFIPIFDGHAVVSARRDCFFRGGAILLNRSQVEIFTAVDDK